MLSSSQFFRGEDNVEQMDDDQHMLVESLKEMHELARVGQIRYMVVATLDDEGYIGYSMCGYIPNTSSCLKLIGTMDTLRHDLTRKMHRVFVAETEGKYGSGEDDGSGGDPGDEAS